MKKYYRTQADILKEVSEETGMKYSIVKNCYDAMLDIMKNAIDTTDVVTMDIPYMGKMYFQKSRRNRYFAHLPTRRRYLDSYHAKLDKIHLLKKENLPINRYHRHFAPRLVQVYSHNHTMEQVESVQHENFKSRLKDHEDPTV